MDLAAGFGGPADQQESGQITINDLSPVAQDLIKGNPVEQIVAGMRGYGAYANLSQGELEQMLEAVNNTAFYQ
jgi:muramidase (phage lysozyme)